MIAKVQLWGRTIGAVSLDEGRDVAVMTVTAPPEFAKAAIPLAWLAKDDTFDQYAVGPGDELMALGFPRGLAANSAGFPILRAGRVASYPLAPSANNPTFLLDFAVFPGNSGGPVYMAQGARRRPTGEARGAGDDPFRCASGVAFAVALVDHDVELRGDPAFACEFDHAVRVEVHILSSKRRSSRCLRC